MTDELQLSKRFKELLDRHGHAFQYAVLHKLRTLFKQRGDWMFEVSEFPVATNSREATRIDFIIRPEGGRFFLAAECKRVNPRYSEWCFLRAPFVKRIDEGRNLLIEEVLTLFKDSTVPTTISTVCKLFPTSMPVYHLGLAVKNHAAADEDCGKGSDAIEIAASQAFRGVNGLVLALSRQRKPYSYERTDPSNVQTYLMPALFTTAKLWTSEVDLSTANLDSGNLSEVPELKQVPWLLMQYPVSPHLRHPFESSPSGYEFAEMLEPRYLRTIAIVNSAGIENFIQEMPRLY